MKPGTKLRHFKGGEYRVDMIAKCAETTRDLVVYTSLAHGTTWVRPLSEFDEHVSRDGYDGPRFLKID